MVSLSLGLLACSERAPEARAPVPAPADVVVVTPATQANPVTPVLPVESAASTSVPDAATALGTTNESRVNPVAGRSNKTMSRAEESTAMPMPGQNNDHSAPLPPAKRASGS